jgi:hypothetical protein
MSRHRLEPAGRVRPRYGRIGAAGLSLAVTMVALLGFLGFIPMGSAAHDQGSLASSPANSSDTDAAGAAGPAALSTAGSDASADPPVSEALEKVAAAEPDNGTSTALPASTGNGKRVVFSKSGQRVWLVDADGAIAATYLVSGSVIDNLDPGKYDVYSRSRWAVGIEDSGVMQFFVRFAHGPNAAIGFHSIPTKNGTPLQTEAQLGTPQSHGCIRQRMSDAERMWNFAGVGTDVVVIV